MTLRGRDGLFFLTTIFLAVGFLSGCKLRRGNPEGSAKTVIMPESSGDGSSTLVMAVYFIDGGTVYRYHCGEVFFTSNASPEVLYAPDNIRKECHQAGTPVPATTLR